MFPRTRSLLPAAGLLALMLCTACGAPPEALPTSPPLPRVTASLPSAGPIAGGLPSVALPPPPANTPPAVTPTFTYPTTTGTTTRPATTPPTTTAGPAPSYAPRCTGEPTGSQIVALAKASPAVPDRNVTVLDGPYCAGGWSITTIGMTGAEPLSVVATGVGATLALVTVGTDVCNPTVKARAPAGIRAMACGS